MTKAERNDLKCPSLYCEWRKADVWRRGKDPLMNVYVYINGIQTAIGSANQIYGLTEYRVRSIVFHSE